jgi:hypothetical protein
LKKAPIITPQIVENRKKCDHNIDPPKKKPPTDVLSLIGKMLLFVVFAEKLLHCDLLVFLQALPLFM